MKFTLGDQTFDFFLEDVMIYSNVNRIVKNSCFLVTKTFLDTKTPEYRCRWLTKNGYSVCVTGGKVWSNTPSATHKDSKVVLFGEVL